MPRELPCPTRSSACPKRDLDFRAIDLSAQGPTSGGGTAVGERFSESPDLDVVAASNVFYRAHPDVFDQLVIWTDTPVVSGGTFAFESTIANEIQGIGVDIFDVSRVRERRAAAELHADGSAVEVSRRPTTRFLGENNTLSVLGQEVGHRWLAELPRSTGQRSEELLGRDTSHWSFFMDSDASVMEGNDIEDLGGGSFRTIAAVRQYAGSTSTRWAS